MADVPVGAATKPRFKERGALCRLTPIEGTERESLFPYTRLEA